MVSQQRHLGLQRPEEQGSTQSAKETQNGSLSQIERMTQARNGASFDPSKLAVIIYGSKEELKTTLAAFARVENTLGHTDTFKLPVAYGDQTRQATLLEGLRCGKATFQDGEPDTNVFSERTHLFSLGNSNPLGLTNFLFTPYLKLVGTEEQVKYWLPLAEEGKIIGSYTQTELGHGTFVAGIETTATFDKETDEFVVNTPRESATKYWPGAIGFTATHTILLARMIIDGQDHGIHPFMMQLKNLKDFKSLEGIELGDIGMKMSYNAAGNGYAVFKSVRIPRSNLLMKHASVSRDGKYTSIPLRQKLLYGGMMNGRRVMIGHVAFQLAQALTIATRYSIVRTQGLKLAKPPNFAETTIINYAHQQHRLLTLIAKSYVAIFAWTSINITYSALPALQAAGNHTTLAYTHMLLCGLKAWATQTAADGAEEARKMCGGHGYMLISGLPEIVNSVLATRNLTFEGENYVRWGQVSHYLMKGLDAETLPADLVYLETYYADMTSSCKSVGIDFRDSHVLLDVFRRRAAKCIVEAHDLVCAAEKGNGLSREQAQNKHAPSLIVGARAHIEVYILEASIKQLASLPVDTDMSIKAVLTRLVSLFGLSTISSPFSPFAASFLSDGYLSAAQILEMRDQIEQLIQELLPDILAICALGCKDGDVYRRIMGWTRQLPINVPAKNNGGVFKAGWEQYIAPFLRENRERRFGSRL
ncbi:acyl-CoA oxidase [Cadophora sp. DSE1049]|nr:acyl-CoA oxidase [Cadophora sp. DSE1049]